MKKLLLALVFCFTTNLFADGKLTFDPALHFSGKLEPKLGLYIGEYLIGPIKYEQWSGGGYRTVPAADSFLWLASKHELSMDLSESLNLFGGVTLRYANSDSAAIKDMLSDGDVHVGLTYKLW